MFVINAVGDALAAAGSMGWEILWPLILGFTLSGVIQAVVRTDQITKLMRDDSPRAISVATGLGALSSSCSYAAVALARALFRKGASLTSAMAFEVASTNLVVELGLILAFVMGWQFTVAEFVGGPLMIILIALGFRLWMRGKIVDAAREQADRGLAGSMEGNAAMDMSVQSDQGFWRRLFSRPGLTSVSQYFVMDWASVLRDIVIGLLIAGAFDAWVPKSWLQALFLEGHRRSRSCRPAHRPDPGDGELRLLRRQRPPRSGAVERRDQLRRCDQLHLRRPDHHPIIVIYRKYYGWKAALRITGIFYAAMVLAGYTVELLFTPLHLIPTNRHLTIVTTSISWNYTTWLNIVFLAIAAFLLIVFTRTGSWPMLRMMSGAPDSGEHDHTEHEHTLS